MSDRLQEIRARLDDCRRRTVLSSQYPADIAWCLAEIDALRERVALLRAEVADLEDLRA